jgi:hypothetical protein
MLDLLNLQSTLKAKQINKMVIKFFNSKYRMNKLVFKTDEQIIGGSFDLFGRIKSLYTSPIRLNYPPSYRDFLSKYGDLLITDFWICKTLIQKTFDNILNVISFGNWQKKKDELNYDDMFHLFGVARLITNEDVLFEKNQVLGIRLIDKNYFKNAKSIYVSQYSENRPPFNLNTMHEQCLVNIGPERMFLYRSDSYNCQHFIYQMFISSGLMNDMMQEFIMQDAKSLVNAMPGLVQRVMQRTTDIASLH